MGHPDSVWYESVKWIKIIDQTWNLSTISTYLKGWYQVVNRLRSRCVNGTKNIQKFSLPKVDTLWCGRILKNEVDFQDSSGNILAINQMFLEGKKPKKSILGSFPKRFCLKSVEKRKTILFLPERIFCYESIISDN